MNRSKQSKSPSPTKSLKESKHWIHSVSETIVSGSPEGLLSVAVQGGAEHGQFCYVGDAKHDKINYHSGKLQKGDLILEIQGQKVAGFTIRDLLDWLKHVGKNGQPVMFKTVKPGKMTPFTCQHKFLSIFWNYTSCYKFVNLNTGPKTTTTR